MSSEAEVENRAGQNSVVFVGGFVVQNMGDSAQRVREVGG